MISFLIKLGKKLKWIKKALQELAEMFSQGHSQIRSDIAALKKDLNMKAAELEEAIGKVNEATTQIGNGQKLVAARIKRLTDKIGTGMTDDQVDSAKTELTTISDHLIETATALTDMAADPADPVPTDPPVLEGGDGGTDSTGGDGN